MSGTGQESFSPTGRRPFNPTAVFMQSPRSSAGSDRSTSSGFSVGGPSHLHDWPLGRSATHERYIKPVPPMYVTEYEASYVWPKTVPKRNGSTVASKPVPQPSKTTPWKELEQAVEELVELERKYPAISQELIAPAERTKQQVHEHLLAENIEKAYKHYKAKLAKLDHSKRREDDGSEESKHEEGVAEEKKDGDGEAAKGEGVRGVNGRGKGTGTGTTLPQPQPRAQVHKEKVKAKSVPTNGAGRSGQKGGTPQGVQKGEKQIHGVQKDGTPHGVQKDGTKGGGPLIPHVHDHRIIDEFREKMEKFCNSVESLKRGETGRTPVK